jgi:hypothetical protein
MEKIMTQRAQTLAFMQEYRDELDHFEKVNQELAETRAQLREVEEQLDWLRVVLLRGVELGRNESERKLEAEHVLMTNEGYAHNDKLARSLRTDVARKEATAENMKQRMSMLRSFATLHVALLAA